MPEHAPLFFNNWYDVGRTAALSAMGFLAMMILLRGSGKRTLSKLNVFDFVFVVAVGSVLASTIMDKTATLLDGIVSLVVLVTLQIILAKAAVYSRTAERIINGEPALLLSNGQFIEKALRKERVTKEEVRAAIREQGIPKVEDVEAVVLENDGSLTVADGRRQGSSSLVDAKDPEGGKPFKKRR